MHQLGCSFAGWVLHLGLGVGLVTACSASPAADRFASDGVAQETSAVVGERGFDRVGALVGAATRRRWRDIAHESDVIGKVTVGYQGWFTAPGDGAPFQGWWHYDADTSNPPSPDDNLLKGWPDMSDFTTRFASGFSNLENGQRATLFSSYSDQTIDAHFRWIEENGIDTVALQRFYDRWSTRNGIAAKVMRAAEAHGRKFYVMYDISGWARFQTELKEDWTTGVLGQLKLTDSSAYARQDGKPVVGIWGMGFADRPGDVASSLDVIDFFKEQGVYVVGGVPFDWRAADGGLSKQDYGAVYDDFDMLSPWMIGVVGNDDDSDAIREVYNEPDIAYCRSHGIAYQPCVLPGDLSLHQRVHGDFMWHQFANMVRLGADALYVSMFDEFGEGNQIAKTAATTADRPADSSLPTLDEDGTACSPDYYLRLTGDGDRMLKGEIPFTTKRPTPSW
jgi:hypothetical protein